MIKVKNIATGEVFQVKNVNRADDDVLVSDVWAPRKSPKFFEIYPMMVRTDHKRMVEFKGSAVECDVLELDEGWVIDTTRKTKTRKHDKTEPKTEPKQETKSETKTEPKAEPVPQPEPKSEPEPKPQPEEKTQANSVEETLINSIRALRGGAMDEARVREIFKEMLAMYAEESPKQVKLAAKRASGNSEEEVYCQDFDDIVDDISDGFHVYLYGPAGSGKSHTAEQVAERLGLDFYGQTTIQFAHDVRGYGDAAGKYQDTPFFKAFKYGGLYFQDEYDRSNSEAAIVLNSALANGWYDFPICGRVEAHPNFRFMAAGNTKMTGPDEDYVTGQIIDASSRDRFATMYKVDYLRKVELHIAKGDTELVDFMEDIRKAIANTNVKHIVSYRATKYATKRKDSDKQKVLSRSILKGLETDEIRIIYGELSNTSNVWAKAMRKLF